MSLGQGYATSAHKVALPWQAADPAIRTQALRTLLPASLALLEGQSTLRIGWDPGTWPRDIVNRVLLGGQAFRIIWSPLCMG